MKIISNKEYERISDELITLENENERLELSLRIQDEKLKERNEELLNAKIEATKLKVKLDNLGKYCADLIDRTKKNTLTKIEMRKEIKVKNGKKR